MSNETLTLTIRGDSRQASAAVNAVKDDVTRACRIMRENFQGLNLGLQSLDGISTKLAGGLGIAAAGMGLVARAGVDMNETVSRATVTLTALSGSADKAAAFVSELRKEAETTAPTFKQLLPIATSLAAAYGPGGLGRVLPTLRAFGDAAARMGADVQAQERALLGFRQLLTRPFAQQEELNQIGESLNLNLSRTLQAKFGTADTEALKKASVTGEQVAAAIVEGFQREFGGAQQELAGSVETLASGITDSLSDIAGQLTSGFTPALKRALGTIKDALGDLANDKESIAALKVPFTELGEAVKDVARQFSGAVKAFNELTPEQKASIVETGTAAVKFTAWAAAIALVAANAAKLVAALKNVHPLAAALTTLVSTTAFVLDEDAKRNRERRQLPNEKASDIQGRLHGDFGESRRRQEEAISDAIRDAQARAGAKRLTDAEINTIINRAGKGLPAEGVESAPRLPDGTPIGFNPATGGAAGKPQPKVAAPNLGLTDPAGKKKQEDLLQMLRRAAQEDFGLTVTSGKRGPRFPGDRSFHIAGQAFDVAGPAENMRAFFDYAKRYRASLAELFLNLPGGEFEAFRNGQPLSRNPEAGRRPHVHFAASGKVPVPVAEFQSRMAEQMADARAYVEELLSSLGVGALPRRTPAQQLAADLRQAEQQRDARSQAAKKRLGVTTLPDEVSQAINAQLYRDQAEARARYEKTLTEQQQKAQKEREDKERESLRQRTETFDSYAEGVARMHEELADAGRLAEAQARAAQEAEAGRLAGLRAAREQLLDLQRQLAEGIAKAAGPRHEAVFQSTRILGLDSEIARLGMLPADFVGPETEAARIARETRRAELQIERQQRQQRLAELQRASLRTAREQAGRGTELAFEEIGLQERTNEGRERVREDIRRLQLPADDRQRLELEDRIREQIPRASPEEVQKLAEEWREALQPAGDVRSSVGQISNAFADLVGVFKRGQDDLGKVIPTVAVALTQLILSIAVASKMITAQAAGPIGMAVAGVAGLVGAIFGHDSPMQDSRARKLGFDRAQVGRWGFDFGTAFSQGAGDAVRRPAVPGLQAAGAGGNTFNVTQNNYGPINSELDLTRSYEDLGYVVARQLRLSGG